MNNTIRIESKSCRMIAHRGVSGLEQENTAAAFVVAAVKTYFGVETDVHVTKDGKFVISHDSNTQRVTGTDMVIETSNYADLLPLTVVDKDGTTRRRDLVLPDLSDYLSICKKYEKVAVLELKESMTAEAISGIAGMVKAMGMFNNTVFISFFKDNLVILRGMCKDAKIQFLTDNVQDETVDFMQKYGFGADLWDGCVTKEAVEKLHKKNIDVNVWTIDDPARAAELIDFGVDFITTNILE